MKYKALVTGRNNSIIDDFFVHMDDNFEVMSTSIRFGDIIRHIKYFSPDVFIYCLSGESQESLRQMNNIKHTLKPARVPFILIGSKEECDEFEKFAVNVTDLVIVKPFTASSIQEKLLAFLDERQEYVEAYRAKTEELEDKAGGDNTKSEQTAASADIESLKDVISSLEAALVPENTAAGPEPKQKAAADSPEPKQKAAPAPVKAAKAEVKERQHILVVDDDPLMLKMLKEQLHDDYDVATAISGKIAMKFLERKRTDLILLDYEMPEESGPAVMEKIRANDAIKDIPIVFLTGVSERDKITEALALKPQSYLLKPIDREKLMNVINSIIG
ncbi:MAG: response regulator [Clostridiales bacterium]|nr:response regulator [Clostridiales bacterium]